jgi:hypothetical protein
MAYITPELRSIGSANTLVLANESFEQCLGPDNVVDKERSYIGELW